MHEIQPKWPLPCAPSSSPDKLYHWTGCWTNLKLVMQNPTPSTSLVPLREQSRAKTAVTLHPVACACRTLGHPPRHTSLSTLVARKCSSTTDLPCLVSHAVDLSPSSSQLARFSGGDDHGRLVSTLGENPSSYLPTKAPARWTEIVQQCFPSSSGRLQKSTLSALSMTVFPSGGTTAHIGRRATTPLSNLCATATLGNGTMRNYARESSAVDFEPANADLTYGLGNIAALRIYGWSKRAATSGPATYHPLQVFKIWLLRRFRKH